MTNENPDRFRCHGCNAIVTDPGDVDAHKRLHGLITNIGPGGQAEIRVRLTDTVNLTEALRSAIVALNSNGFNVRSAALYDLAEAVTRHLGLEWNPYGQTYHPRPDGLGMDITRRDEDIRP